MKRFLYYNQDSVNSFLAQIEQGLLTKESSGEEQAESFSGTTGIKSDLSGDLSAKVFGIGASLKGDIQGDDSSTEVASNLIRSVQEKALHDYAFERLYNHVVENGLINNTTPNIGDIVLVNEVPTFLDFDYFQMLFAENGPVKLVNDENKKNLEPTIEQIKASSPKDGAGAVVAKQRISALRAQVSNAETERKDLARQMDVIRNTLPYDRFIMTTNMLVPLDDENFRDNPSVIAFKYGGNISILGYVTNIVSIADKPKNSNAFAELYDTVNKVMLNMFNNQDKIYVVHPVALFY